MLAFPRGHQISEWGPGFEQSHVDFVFFYGCSFVKVFSVAISYTHYGVVGDALWCDSL